MWIDRLNSLPGLNNDYKIISPIKKKNKKKWRVHSQQVLSEIQTTNLLNKVKVMEETWDQGRYNIQIFLDISFI